MPIRRRIELSIAESRLRFQQLVRLTGLTGQVTVVVDGGRPIAAIVPAADVLDPPRPPAAIGPADPPRRSAAIEPADPPRRSAATGPADPPRRSAAIGPADSPRPPAAESSAGWLRRIEKVREDVRRQHAGRIRELSQALDEAWQLIDTLRPPGTDRHADSLRAAHGDLRRTR